MAPDKKKKKNTAVWDALIMVFQFGINMIVPIGMCMALGIWIGKQTGAMWVSVPLFFVGALAGGTNVYKMSRKLIKQTDERSKVKRELYQIRKATSEKQKGQKDVKKNQ